jgi:hypothetical protein
VASHEINHFRRRFFSRANEVAFVLAVLVVNDDDHAPVADVGDRVMDGAEWHGLSLLLAV